MRFMKTYLSTYTLLASFFFGFCHSASAERAVELNDGSGQSRKLIYGSLMTAGEVIQSLKDDAIRDNKEVRKFESCQCATSVHTNLGYELQPYTISLPEEMNFVEADRECRKMNTKVVTRKTANYTFYYPLSACRVNI